MSEEENKQSTSEERESVQETPKTSNKAKKGGNGIKLAVVLIVVAIAIFALFKFDILGGGATPGSGDSPDDPDKVVASVIGTTITRADLDEKIEQVRLSMPEGSADPTEDASFELQLLEDLIDLELLTAAALEKNYTVSIDEVEAEIESIKEQFGSEEAFTAQLEAVGITNEELRENIETEMHIRRLLEEETELETIEVTEEEIASLYEMSVGDAEDVPPLEEVSEIIRAQLTNQKSAEIIDAYVTALRENAEVEIML